MESVLSLKNEDQSAGLSRNAINLPVTPAAPVTAAFRAANEITIGSTAKLSQKVLVIFSVASRGSCQQLMMSDATCF